MRRASMAVCVVAAAACGQAAQASAAAYQYGVRLGPATYSHALGASTIYGVHVELPVPLLDVSGSLEYVGKNAATYDPGAVCLSAGCPSAVEYNFRDVSGRVTLSIPLAAAPGVGSAYAGGGIGYHMIRVPSYARPTGDEPPHEFAVGSQIRSSYHALVGGRLGVLGTRLGGFAELRLTWVQTSPVLRQVAGFVGVSVHP